MCQIFANRIYILFMASYVCFMSGLRHLWHVVGGVSEKGDFNPAESSSILLSPVDRTYTTMLDHAIANHKIGILLSFRYGRKENILKLAWRFFQAFWPVYQKKTYFVHSLYEINNNLGQCKYSWICIRNEIFDHLPKANNLICILHVLWFTLNRQGTCVNGICSYINLTAGA